MHNQIYRVSAEEMAKIKQEIEKDQSLFIAEINGREMHQFDDYFYEMYKICEFPTLPCSFDSYIDWMTDLQWLEKDGYIVIIHDFKHFLDWDRKDKENVVNYFANRILPYWQKDVETQCVGGKPKPFNVYLVD